MNASAFPVVARALALAIAAAAPALAAAADGQPPFDGYDAYWQTLPRPLFTTADERKLDDPQSLDGQAFLAWGAVPPDGHAFAPRQHRVEILGPDLTVDRRALPFARAQVFPGEVAAELGADARLFVGARDVCVQGTAPSASGTAQRHVHVVLVTDAFTRKARRHDLPSLFGSCLALRKDEGGDLRFPEGRYHTPDGAPASDGVDFQQWLLRDGRFVRTTGQWKVRFPDPENVYRFNAVGP